MIPQHIHLNVQAQGFQDGIFQMVFADDPAMTAHWMDWAKKRGHPIVTLHYSETSGTKGVVTLQLKK